MLFTRLYIQHHIVHSSEYMSSIVALGGQKILSQLLPSSWLYKHHQSNGFEFFCVCPNIWHVCVILICSDLVCILSSALFLLPFPHCIHLQPESNSIINSHMSQSNFSPFCTLSMCLLTPCLPVHSPSHSLHSYLSPLCSFLMWQLRASLLLFLCWQIW